MGRGVGLFGSLYGITFQLSVFVNLLLVWRQPWHPFCQECPFSVSISLIAIQYYRLRPCNRISTKMYPYYRYILPLSDFFDLHCFDLVTYFFLSFRETFLHPNCISEPLHGRNFLESNLKEWFIQRKEKNRKMPTNSTKNRHYQKISWILTRFQ